MFKVVERAKWDAWNSVKNLSKEEAMTAYVDEIKNV
jgi:acyl-CoA-binding protein